jgi:hypothetical protein
MAASQVAWLLAILVAETILQQRRGILMMIDLKPRLIAALGNAQEYIDLATSAKDRGERAFYERIAELYIKIARELEALV